MDTVWLQTLVSVGIVSLISLVGVTVLARFDREGGPIKFLIALAIGALLGDVALHILPESYEELGIVSSWWLLGGFGIFFLLEKVLHWRHEHASEVEGKIEPFGVMNLVADGLHNLIDGALIAASYAVSLPVGLATTVAVVLHEIPQELGDYAVLRSAGFSKARALIWNFVSALFAILGAIIALAIGIDLELNAQKVLAFTAGGFLYIVVLLVQRLGSEVPFARLASNVAGAATGVLAMWLLTLIENGH